MNKKHLNPEDFTQIMGSYSHGVKVDVGNSEMIFITGQIAMDKEGNAIAPKDIVKQTEFIFKNIQRVLKEADSSLGDIVKIVIYVTKISDFSKISPIRDQYLKDAKPASTLVEINKTVKEGCDIEIEAIAIKSK